MMNKGTFTCLENFREPILPNFVMFFILKFNKMLNIFLWIFKNLNPYLFGTDCDQDRITWGNPQKWCSDSLPFLIGHLGVRAPYATRRKLRYEANQVWMNTTFISQGLQSSGI